MLKDYLEQVILDLRGGVFMLQRSTPSFGKINYIAGWTGEAPAQSHKLTDGGSTPSPAT